MVEITMFWSRSDLECEMERIETQEDLRGRHLTADEIADPALDLPTTN